jgi:hypothetical protein
VGSLSAVKTRLDPSKAISTQLISIVDAALKIASQILSEFHTPSTVDKDVVTKYRSEIGELVIKAQQVVTKANLVCQQPGTVGTGPATPPTPSNSSKSAEVRCFTCSCMRCSLWIYSIANRPRRRQFSNQPAPGQPASLARRPQRIDVESNRPAEAY